MLAELDERNVDNVSRTESYLELYEISVLFPPDLPWLLLAHLVSRNAGYLMTGLRSALDDERRIFSAGALEQLFMFLERANFLIFYDAWHHVIQHMLGRSRELSANRTPALARQAWARYESHVSRPDSANPGTTDPAVERQLVLDLVTNEQTYIEHRVVHEPRYQTALSLVRFFEATGRERTLVFGGDDTGICVGRFEALDRRIAAGTRLFDEILRDRDEREALLAWSKAHPHTGSRSDYGGRTSRSVREAWPPALVHTLDPSIHAPPDPAARAQRTRMT